MTSIQKYRVKVVLITDLEDRLEVQFEFLAGIYELYKKHENFATLSKLLLEAKNNSKEVEFSVLGSRIVELSIYDP